MKIIEIKPTKNFGGAWCAYEAPGVSPCYPGPSGGQSVIDYAHNCRFGGTPTETVTSLPNGLKTISSHCDRKP